MTAEAALTVTGGTSHGGGGGDGCRYQNFDELIAGVPWFGWVSWPHPGPNGRLVHIYQKTCADGSSNYYMVEERVPADILPQALHELRTKAVPAPELRVIGDPQSGWAYARVPVDFRVDNATPVSVTARLPAPWDVWVTVTATPTRITFAPGEPGGRSMSCTVAAARADYDALHPGACSYTYLNSSAIAGDPATFTATATIEWAVASTSSGGSATQPAISTSRTAPVTVGEIQAVIVSN